MNPFAREVPDAGRSAIRKAIGAGALAIGLIAGAWGPARAVDAPPATASTTTPTPPAPTTAATTPAPFPGALTAPADWDGQACFPVSRFDVRYRNNSPGVPSLDELRSIPIALAVIGDEYVVPPNLERKWREQGSQPLVGYVPRSLSVETHRLSEWVGEPPRKYRASAVWAIDQQITSYLNNRKNLIGVYVSPDDAQVDPNTLADRRTDDLSLALVVQTGVVSDVRTVASGQRIPASDPRINNRLHDPIRRNSPVQAAGSPGGTAALRRDLLDDYIFRLNRLTGRHVDVAISAASEKDPGRVVLDYLVQETRAWSVYTQVSNTGTKQTDEWRERFGFATNQLTNHDDILTLDYTTAGFSKSHTVNVAYEAPFSTGSRLRYRGYGTYQQFTASDVGFTQENFSGEEFIGGGELIYNIYQRRDAFLDLAAGARYQDVRVDNTNVMQTGQASFVVPYLSLRFERNAEISSTTANVTFMGRFSGANQDQLNRLGRLNTSKDAYLVTVDATHAFFLEPILNRKKFEEAKGTLAHELALSLHSQYTFGDRRLIPQAEEIAGGFYSVRGYPESIAAGDTVVVGSAEYRLHIPRVFQPREVPQKTSLNRLLGQEFRVVPQVPYGHPDWDVVFRAFFDGGHVFNNKRLSFERDQTLLGTGVGLELQLRQNFNIRVDYGIPLTSVPNEVTAGSGRVHFSASLLY